MGIGSWLFGGGKKTYPSILANEQSPVPNMGPALRSIWDWYAEGRTGKPPLFPAPAKSWTSVDPRYIRSSITEVESLVEQIRKRRDELQKMVETARGLADTLQRIRAEDRRTDALLSEASRTASLLGGQGKMDDIVRHREIAQRRAEELDAQLKRAQEAMPVAIAQQIQGLSRLFYACRALLDKYNEMLKAS